jgi:alkylation response protein AidB-like acyl-CoA dehydrogenase
MDFKLSDEQRMLKESARKLIESEVEPYLARFPEDRQMPSSEIKNLLKKFIPLGYLGSTVPEETGGAGMDFMTYILLMEELLPVLFLPLMITASGPRMIHAMGSEDLQKTYLPPLFSGDKIACAAITEPNVGSNTAAIQTRGVLDGDDYVLNGSKMWISNGAFSDLAMVLARTDTGRDRNDLTLFLVDKEVSPFEAKATPIMGDDLRIPHVGELTFEDCRVNKANMMGVPGEGLKATFIMFQTARCLVAMNSVVFAQRALDATIRYAKERTQFGKPIGAFQLIQAMIADMAALTDAARLLTYRASALVGEVGRFHREASMAKFYATEAAVKVTSMAVQVHGAYGLSPEYPVEKLFQGARVMTIPDGTTQIQQLIVARELLGLSAFV